MTARFRLALAAALLTSSSLIGPAAIAKDPVTPEQRIGRLEKQVRQVQKVVFPKGQPADTAGFDDAPAATQDSVTTLTTRLDTVERQMADLTRQSEENANRLSVLETELARVRADTDRRFRENQSAPGADAGAGDAPAVTPPAATATTTPASSVPGPKYENKPATAATTPAASAPAAAVPLTADQKIEADYDAGYQLWNSGKYAAAYDALIKFAKANPNHRRASWAYNLAGRALLDQGQARKAADVLLANYRRDPQGERAQDSLFYLADALMKLDQPGQACKVYEELDSVYGASIRAPLKAALPAAKAKARC